MMEVLSNPFMIVGGAIALAAIGATIGHKHMDDPLVMIVGAAIAFAVIFA